MKTYRPIIVVLPKKVKQWVHAFFVMEQFCREVTVKELHSVTNGL